MHACGHDAHVIMLLGAAKLFQRRKDELKGTVKLVFQPGEEGRAGAYHMLQEGALDDVQAIFGMHVVPGLPTGLIASRPGPLFAASSRFIATIKGKGGHSAIPQNAADPVLAASFSILSLQQIVSRETDPLDSRVVSVGYIKGGEASNVIPEYVTFGGTLRSMTTKGLSDLSKRIKEVIESQATVHRCTATSALARQSWVQRILVSMRTGCMLLCSTPRTPAARSKSMSTSQVVDHADPFTIPSDYTWISINSKDEKMKKSKSRKGKHKEIG